MLSRSRSRPDKARFQWEHNDIVRVGGTKVLVSHSENRTGSFKSSNPMSVVQFGRDDWVNGERQSTSQDCADGKYARGARWVARTTTLSGDALALGDRIFVPLSKRAMQPGKAHAAARGEFLVSTEHALGFLGVGGHDLSRLLHLVLIPAHDEARPSLRWVFDLVHSDLPLLAEMRQAGLAFFRENVPWFRARYAAMDVQRDLRGRSLEYWLREENVSFGFHANPSVGYLHMHMLVGPLTTEGYSERYRDSWVPLEAVIEVLSVLRPMSTELFAPLQLTDVEECKDGASDGDGSSCSSTGAGTDSSSADPEAMEPDRLS